MSMEKLPPEVSLLLEYIQKGEKMVALLAPSFPIMFSYPRIVGKLRRLGFEKIIEVSIGAAETNRQLLELVRENPTKKFIASPCPTIVRLIRSKYPHLLKYLTPIDSPMVATAKLVAKELPGYKIIFIGPCLLKKMEASQDYPELSINALTYRELNQVFKIKKIGNLSSDVLASFDQIKIETRLYPISGGLSQSSGVTEKMTDEEYDVVSGPPLVEKALLDFESNRHLRLLDILNCEGGCINGPGIESPLNLDQRRKKVIAHWAKSIR